MPDHLARFNQHVKDLNLSRTDDFIINSLKLTYFSGWAAAMDSLTMAWFQPKAETIRAELERAVAELQKAQAEVKTDENEWELDLSDPEPVAMDYSKLKID